MKRNHFMKIWLAAAFLALTLSACGASEETTASLQTFQEKADLLKAQAITEDILWEIGDTPAGAIGHAVFLSVCDGETRASVYSGTGETLEDAWEAAETSAESALKKNGLQPLWVKADVTYHAEAVAAADVSTAIGDAREEFFRYGVAFDNTFGTALLEAELNGSEIYDYDNGCIDLEQLNHYLKASKRTMVDQLPDSLTLFRCFGWLCDEDNTIHALSSDNISFGRRKFETLDAETAKGLIDSASDFLGDQLQEDGSFIYGYSPRFGETIEDYNIIRHTCTIWALLCRYRMEPNEELAGQIEKAIDYMLTQVVTRDDGTAYLYDASEEEIKVGAGGVAVIVLTEYMELFENDTYLDTCRQLGLGILSMMDQKTGIYYHVWNKDFTPKEPFRIVYYDGEATFALCKLYGLTGEQLWLDAACSAVDHFIEADYTQHKDHWVAYSMNEITKHVTDRADYYAFALQNVQKNLDTIYERDTTYHTYLELLMATFELYDRLAEMGAEVNFFDQDMFLKTIYTRADRMLNGFFFPEYAMYMEHPNQILETFMVRHDDYRVRIDDVQHNITGYYLYWKNYDKLVSYGLLDSRK